MPPFTLQTTIGTPPPAASAPVIDGLPTYTGTVATFATLIAVAAPVTGTAPIARQFQWSVGGNVVATGTTFFVDPAYLGETLTLTQSETNSEGNDTATTVGVTITEGAAPTASFRVFTNISPRADGEVLQGDTIDVVEHQGLAVVIDNLVGWVEDDPRTGWNEIDFGERYEQTFLDGADLLPEQQFLRGTTLGRYPGFNAGHAFRGTDMSGNPQLSAQNPTRTQTVTVYRSDGINSFTLTFNVRVVRQQEYYTDLTKQTYGLDSPETLRRGLIYVTRDGDFTGAPPAGNGVYHHTLVSGNFTRNTFSGNQTANGGPNYPWGSNDLTGMAILFKAGQTFYQTAQITVPGPLVTWGSWGDGLAIISYDNLRRWNETFTAWRNNGSGDSRPIFHGIEFVASEFDVSQAEWREWWNVLRYTGKVGTFAVNERITNGAGVFTQVVHDTGSELWTRQVVNSEDINLVGNDLAAFSDGDTLTGTGGATCTFVAAGSRQDRTKKWPMEVYGTAIRGATFDKCRIRGARVGITGLGRGSVLSDMAVVNSFDYAFFLADYGGEATWIHFSGVHMTQPVGYYSEPVSTSFGQSVAQNRRDWNTGSQTLPGFVAENRIRHSALRAPKAGFESFHYCGVHWYGGHGAAPQQLFRMSTSSGGSDEDLYIMMYGCTLAGGQNHLGWGMLNATPTPVPQTPKGILIESTQFLATRAMGAEVFTRFRHNSVTVRNCIFDAPAGVTLGGNSDPFAFIDFENWPTFDGAADVGWRQSYVEFCTFRMRADGRTSAAVPEQDPQLRLLPNSVTWRNNVYDIDPSKVASIAPEIAALNEFPSGLASDLRPQVGALAYQSATAPVTRFDATGAIRPTDGTASRGALEPSA